MKILVCGAGTMGAGIAQVMAQAGHEVFLRDIKDEFVQRGLQGIEKNLNRNVEKGRMNQEDKDAVMARLKPTVDIEPAKDVDFVLEAIIERMDLKKELFQELDKICGPDVILASNTSALSISEVAASTSRPDKVIGMHFFNPAPVMKLVEVIKGANTSEETFQKVKDFAVSLGKTPVVCEEAPGFIVNRILVPMINEAAFILQEGVATPEDIDVAMKLGANHPIGPLALGDLIGLDVCLFIMETLYDELGESKYRPAPLLRKMVRAGQLGRKTGKGFFTY